MVEFLESLHRICKVGTYYPAGHVALDQAAGHFQKKISKVADTNRSVLIELQGETLRVAGMEIARLTNALQELKKLLFDLGVNSLEIDRTILMPELLQLVKSLLLGRSRLQGIKKFTQAAIVDLPSSVRIQQKEFLVDESAVCQDGKGEGADHGLDSVFLALADMGLEGGQVEQCRSFLSSLAEKFSGRPLNLKGLPSVTWSDVRNLLVKIVSGADLHSMDSGGVATQNDLRALSAILQGLEKETQDKGAQKTINLLISVFGDATARKKTVADSSGKAKRIRSSDNTPVQSVWQLQAFIDDNAMEGTTLAKLNQIDRREELSILLQLLQYQQVPTVESKIRQNLRDILTSQLNEGELEILTGGLMQLATGTERNRFYEAMQFLAPLARGAKNFTSHQFLVMICQKISAAARALLWPILVNEILATGRTIDRKAFDELVTIAARLPDPEMRERWPELQTMDCFQDKKIAADTFNPKHGQSFPLFSFLLETSMKKQIGARILSGLIAYPPDWLIEAVAPLLQLDNPQHIKFLQVYLLVAQQKNFSVKLRVAAGTLVVHHLPELTEEQRRETWVIKTILASPELQIEETRPLLERIRDEKRMLIVPIWPVGCRRAAAEALKNLRRKPL